MRFAAVVAALVALPSLCLAQIRGVVRDEAGQPVPDALVELLSAGARIAATATDSAGRFAFNPNPAAVAITVRKIGHVPARLQLVRTPAPLAIVLRRRVVPVQGVTVEAAGGRCVERDQAAARRLWERATQRYANGALMTALWADARQGAADVPPDSFGAMDTTRTARAQIGMTGVGLRRSAPAERFYAQPPLLGVARSYQWDYPFLESVLAWHFADRRFGELNRLELEPPEVGDLVIAFCSSSGERPYIVGHLYLAADTTFLKADWRFVTSQPREQAGGDVVFMPPAPGAPLLAASGQFWRAKASGFYQEWSSYLQWYVCEGFRAGCAADQRRPLGR